ncbi:hypothetical protein C8R47DRAFT_1193496 [Mycena vitilis]|nr:hypothetical protein C8R47DRAFT_1193496 [Mycena vitilis]
MPAPSASTPPASPPRKRARKSSPPSPRAPRTVQAPMPGAAPRLRHDTSSAPCLFEQEGHRAVGAVVRQLVPGCKKCASKWFCTDDTDPSEPTGPARRRCLRCFNAHIACGAWGAFSAAYSTQDGEALSRFVFEYREHLGNGMYQLLTPDDRLADLASIAREFPYWTFLHRFLPLQNTRCSFLRPGDLLGHPLTTQDSSPTSQCSPSGAPSASSSPPSPDPSDSPLDFDLEEEPALPPSQQASSSRLPPPRGTTVSANPSPPSRSAIPRARTEVPGDGVFFSAFGDLLGRTQQDLLGRTQQDDLADAIAQDAYIISVFFAAKPGFDDFVAYMRELLDLMPEEGPESESTPKSDWKEKGRAL